MNERAGLPRGSGQRALRVAVPVSDQDTAEPLCVAVTYRHKQVDLTLPSQQPISAYIADVVDALAAINDIDFPSHGRQWTLAKPDAPINPERSLAEARINDGGLLHLTVVTPTERYRPITEDVVDAVAASDDRNSRQFDSAAVRLAGLVGLVAGGLFLCAAQWQMWAANHLSVMWAAVGTVGGVVALIGLWSAASRYRAPDAAAAWTVVWLAAVAAVGQWAPVPGQADSPGLLNLAVAAVGVCAGALCAMMITGAHLGVFSAITAGAGVVATVAIVLRLTNVAQSALAAGLLIGGLIALSAMPWLVSQLARISPRRLLAFRGNIGAASEFTDGMLVRLQDRARRAVQLRSALTMLTAGVVAAAAVWTLDPDSELLPVEIGIVACTTLILALRGRTMTDRSQAYALFAAASATIFVSAGRLILAWPTGWRPAVVVGVVALTTATWVICAVVLSSRSLTPVWQRWTGRVEEVGIVLVIPLCVWVSGTFAVIRNMAIG